MSSNHPGEDDPKDEAVKLLGFLIEARDHAPSLELPTALTAQALLDRLSDTERLPIDEATGYVSWDRQLSAEEKSKQLRLALLGACLAASEAVSFKRMPRNAASLTDALITAFSDVAQQVGVTARKCAQCTLSANGT